MREGKKELEHGSPDVGVQGQVGVGKREWEKNKGKRKRKKEK